MKVIVTVLGPSPESGWLVSIRDRDVSFLYGVSVNPCSLDGGGVPHPIEKWDVTSTFRHYHRQADSGLRFVILSEQCYTIALKK